MSVSSSTGLVSDVAVTHASVVIAMVTSRTMSLGMSAPARLAMANASATTNELAIAVISLHALMRHQYQRRM